VCARAQAPRVRVGSRRVRLWRAFFSCSPRTPPFLSRTRAGPPRWRPTPPHMELLAYSPLHPGRGRGGWRAGPGRAGLLKRAVRARACASSQRGFRKQGAPTAFFSPRTPHLFGRASPPPPRPLTLSPTLSALQTMTSRLLNVVLAMACIRRPDTMPSTSAKKEEAALVRSSKPAFFPARGAARSIKALPASKVAAKKLAAAAKKQAGAAQKKKLTAVITTSSFAASRRPATAGTARDVRTARRVRFTLPSVVEEVMEEEEVKEDGELGVVVAAPTTTMAAAAWQRTTAAAWQRIEELAAAAASKNAAARKQQASARAARAAASDAKAVACLLRGLWRAILGSSSARLLAFEAVARAFAHPATIGEAGGALAGASTLMKELNRAAAGWAAVEVEEEAEAEVVALVAPSTTTATPAPPAGAPLRTWAQVVDRNAPSAADNAVVWAQLLK